MVLVGLPHFTPQNGRQAPGFKALRRVSASKGDLHSLLSPDSTLNYSRSKCLVSSPAEAISLRLNSLRAATTTAYPTTATEPRKDSVHLQATDNLRVTETHLHQITLQRKSKATADVRLGGILVKVVDGQCLADDHQEALASYGS